MPDIATLHNLYSTDPNGLLNTINDIYDRIEREGLNPIWISIIPREKTLDRVKQLSNISVEDRAKLSLYGIPFAVKDNIDVRSLPTTAACQKFGSQPANENAPVVDKLEKAGAILIGKTNMDQFATGLVGTRSPYGVCSSVFNSNYISGGSSSGSAVAVGSQLVTFSLGTDTAGSGRVPAMFNNIIGLKPTRGLLSTHGVIPACRSLDCVSIFAETAADASTVLSVASGFDELDPYSRNPSASASPWVLTSTFRFGIPTITTRQFFGDNENPILFEKAIDTIQKHLGGQPVEVDLQPFLDVASLLYKGPWVAERYAAVGQFVDQYKNDIDPTVYTIITKSKDYTAVDTFNGIYELERLKKKINKLWENFDILLVPTAPRTYTINEIQQAPIERNSHLGYYTNFVNLLDLAAIAIPAGIRQDGLPFGVTIISHAFTDTALSALADQIHRSLATFIGGNSTRLLSNTPKLTSVENNSTQSSNCFLLAVVGAHLSGQPLNYQLTERKARLVRTCRTNEEYRLYALKNTTPAKPGLLRTVGSKGPGIEVETWAVPNDTVGTFIKMIPPPLTIGNIYLEDGQIVKGFLVEPSAIESAQDITHMGGWRNYLNHANESK